jgi:hypothetical protein
MYVAQLQNLSGNCAVRSTMVFHGAPLRRLSRFHGSSTQNYHYNDREDNFSRAGSGVLEWVVNICEMLCDPGGSTAFCCRIKADANHSQVTVVADQVSYDTHLEEEIHPR